MEKWIIYHFRIGWPKGSDLPASWIDHFICDSTLRDVIDNGDIDIKCWRIHRRWDIKNKKGHVLAFHVYIDDKFKDEIESSIRSNSHFILLDQNGKLEKLDIEDNNITQFDGNGEGYWSPSLKRNFPPYIQGICETFFNILSDARENVVKIKSIEDLPDLIEDIEDTYLKIEAHTRKLWQIEGRFLLHHFNAIFGYDPTLISF